MTDIVAIETAKAEEQAGRLFRGLGDIDDPAVIVTALLEAKADILEEHAPNAGKYGYSPYCRLLREEVNNRKARGL